MQKKIKKSSGQRTPSIDQSWEKCFFFEMWIFFFVLNQENAIIVIRDKFRNFFCLLTIRTHHYHLEAKKKRFRSPISSSSSIIIITRFRYLSNYFVLIYNDKQMNKWINHLYHVHNIVQLNIDILGERGGNRGRGEKNLKLIFDF